MTKEERKEYNHQLWIALKNDPERYKEHCKRSNEYRRWRYHKVPNIREKGILRTIYWNSNNKEKRNLAKKRWREKNQDKTREYTKRYYYKTKQNGPENYKAKLVRNLERNREKKEVLKNYATLYVLMILSKLPRSLPSFCYQTKKPYQFNNPVWY